MTEPASQQVAAAPIEQTPFRRVHPLTPLLRGGIFVLAWIGWLLNRMTDGGLQAQEVLISGVGVLVAGVAVGAGSWWFTRYRIDAEEILVESGLLVRRSRRVRIERLQAVEVQQPVLARVLGMAELKLETAGADGSAVKLAFLPLAEATRLRAELLERSEVGAPDDDHASHQRDVPLFRVDAVRLAVSLCLRTGFVLAVGSAAAFLMFSLFTGRSFGWALLLAAMSGVVSFWVRQLLVWGRFEIDATVQGLRVRSGLLSLRSQTVPVGRVQGVVVIEPLLWRLFGWARLDVTVAGVGSSDDETQQLESALIPVADRSEVDALVVRLLGVDPGTVPLARPPVRSRWLSPVGRRLLGVGVSANAVVTRRGVLTTRTDVVPRAKIQSVRLLQGPLQRRLRLATTRVNLPSGPVDALALHRDEHEAWDLVQTLAEPA
uniref:Transmembrane protein, distant homology with ydbT n=1 Tax=uncultured Nocardioidaceae bacterium TaxID=253824 RepID=A0A6J4L440_9ACTN|nr:MAG: transmembrane protein, distant homology with ydbT [uncultured Nocardioidaceae bacterium]